MMHKAWCNVEEVPYHFFRSSIKFQGHTGWKIDNFNPISVRLLGRSQLSNASDLPCLPSAAIDPTGIVVGHCVRPAVCPSVRPERRSRSNSLRISLSAWNLVGWCTVPWSRSLFKMAMLGQFLHVPRNFEIFHDRFFFYLVWGRTLPL